MAISFGRALATGLSAGVKALGEAAKEEEEKREDITKITLAQQLKNVEEAKKNARTQQALIDAENQAVDSLAGQRVPMKGGGMEVITPSMARAVVRKFGADNANKMILQGQIAFSKESFTEGKTAARATKKEGAIDIGTISAFGKAAGKGKGGALFGDRYSAVAKNTEEALRAMGLDPAGVDIPQLAAVTGVESFAGPAFDKVEATPLFTKISGLESVVKETTTNPMGETTVAYKDLLGNNVTAKVQGLKPDQVSTDKDSLYPDFKDFGLAFKIKADGTVETLRESIAFDQYGVAYRKDNNGEFTIPIKDKSIMTLNKYQIEQLGGASGVEDKFDILSTKEGRKAFQDFNEQSESYEYLTKIFQEQISLVQEHGDALVAPVGAVSEWVEFAKVNLGVGLKVVKDAAGELGIDFDTVDVAGIQRKTNTLQQSMAEETDPEKKLAIARKLYTSRQIIAAYYYAKSTGDTRISNQDFDQFLKTVSAGSAAAQMAMYKARMDEAKTAVTSKYTTFTSYLPSETSTDPQKVAARSAMLESIPESRRPESMTARLDAMFEPSVKTKTVEQINQEIDTAEKTAKQYSTQKAFIRPDGTLTDNTDPQGKEAWVVYKNGKVVFTPQGQPVIDDSPDTTKEDVERDIMLFIQSGILQ